MAEAWRRRGKEEKQLFEGSRGEKGEWATANPAGRGRAVLSSFVNSSF